MKVKNSRTNFRSITHLKKSRATSQRIQAAGITKEFSAPNLEKRRKLHTKTYFHTKRSTFTLEKKSIQQKIDNLQIIKYLSNIMTGENQENSCYFSYLSMSVQLDPQQDDLRRVRRKLSPYKSASPARSRAR